jgi:type II secretory pathway component GspD/PulD (secretin)
LSFHSKTRPAAIAACLALALAGAAAAQIPPSGTGATASTESPVAGQRISLDLKGVDILDVLKLLSQKSGLNFVAGRNVSGRVTIFVSEVDVWDAFELILSANDLAYEKRGDIVTVMTARDYELLFGEKFQVRTKNAVVVLKHAKGVQVATVLNQIKTTVGRVVVDEPTNTLIIDEVPGRFEDMLELVETIDRPTEARVYNLNYTEAEKLKEKIQDLLSPIGTFTFDVRTNKAVVSDLKEVLAKVDQIVKAFDTPDGQVLIEAKIVKVELTDQMDLGIDWHRVFSGIDTTVAGNFDVVSGDVVGGDATGIGLEFIKSPDANASVIIEALEKITNTDTLSNPRIMVSNNQEAKILVGTKEAVVTVTTTVPATGSTVSSPEIQYVDVGTKLFVTPNIKRDGHIQMKIRPEVSTSRIETFQTNRIPIVTSTEAETSVLVKSGVTLIIGGLIESKDTLTNSKVPFLGDLPVVGLPFRGTTDLKTKTELVVFLTPQIVMPDGSPYVPPGDGGPGEGLGPVPPSYGRLVRQRLQDLIAAEMRAAQLPAGSVRLAFILNSDGAIAGDPLISSAEGEPFLRAAREALAKAQPFPPFHEGATAEQVRFTLEVEYAP